MRKKIMLVITMVLAVSVYTGRVVAQDELAQDEAAVQEQVVTQSGLDQNEREKDILIANINTLSGLEVRVSVLRQLLNEQINNLRQAQALFCDQYKLDLEKYRSGAYVYDEKQGKLVERPAGDVDAAEGE